eukprot:gnl/MRDRNA2_/MRDRNA2_73796_c0_seq1.p1 gnl/MRDRNA2_/MRDRNA2_73796_c0~~gnl/MRDRNA2_/MRDRNA2_73796_c0_seq1.p1  ORF type:complete len:158 (-),score=11.87 gnl/MRDRNA2_/MRDRNA2_73796_c0_seq1:113-586(-)
MHQVRIKETALERGAREAHEMFHRNMVSLSDKIAAFDPSSDPNIQGDPFKTLFLARLSYSVTEKKLRRDFEEFGSLSRVRIVTDKISGKSRGYAFIEFEHVDEMKRAYKIGMNRYIEGRRVIADVERGRTVGKWKPRRLGGGLGGEGRLIGGQLKAV